METERKFRKTNKCVIFQKGGLPPNLLFTYDNMPLKIEQKFTYLGIVLSNSKYFTITQSVLAGQVRKAMFTLDKYLNYFLNVKPDIVCELFDKMIVPILSYGCEIWGFNQWGAIERVHLQLQKRTSLSQTWVNNNSFRYRS